MKIVACQFTRAVSKLAAVSFAALLGIASGASIAAPVAYTFQSTNLTPLVLSGSDPAVANAAIAALGPNPVISGSFIYNAAAPLTFAGTATGGTT